MCTTSSVNLMDAGASEHSINTLLKKCQVFDASVGFWKLVFQIDF